jgi:uridylate kinase
MQKWKKVILKISGEAFKGKFNHGQDLDAVEVLAADIASVSKAGTQLCLVVGGGNISRGSSVDSKRIDRARADYMGMLGTVINALCLQAMLDHQNVKSKVLSSVAMDSICETYSQERALYYMSKGIIVIFAAGIGNPFVSTDTAAVFRGIEMHCDVLLKGTQVEGVYSGDPKTDKNAKKFDELTYDDVLNNHLRVIDLPAISVAGEHKLPIVVFSIHKKNEISNVLNGKGNFTIIK